MGVRNTFKVVLKLFHVISKWFPWHLLGKFAFYLPSPLGFPGGSAGKESACNAGDPGSTPGWGSSPGEGIGYPLQYFWTPLMVQIVKNPPAMWETWVRSLGWEDPLEKGTATHSSILAWRIPQTEESGGLQSMGSQRVGHNWVAFNFTTISAIWLYAKHLRPLSSLSSPIKWG